MKIMIKCITCLLTGEAAEEGEASYEGEWQGGQDRQ